MFDFGALPVELVWKIVDELIPPGTDSNGVYKSLRRLAMAIPDISNILDSQICYIICQDPTSRLPPFEDPRIFKDKFNYTFVNKINIFSASSHSSTKERPTKGDEANNVMDTLLMRSNVFTVDIENMPESLQNTATTYAEIHYAMRFLMVLNLYDELMGTKIASFEPLMKEPSLEDRYCLLRNHLAGYYFSCAEDLFEMKFWSCVDEIRQRILKILLDSQNYRMIYITSDIDSRRLSKHIHGRYYYVELPGVCEMTEYKSTQLERIVEYGPFPQNPPPPGRESPNRQPDGKIAIKYNLPRR